MSGTTLGQDPPQLLELLRRCGTRGRPGSREPERLAAGSGSGRRSPSTARSSSASSIGPVERLALGGALHLDERAVAGHHDVHVGLGADVLLVGQVEPRLAVDDARPTPPPPSRSAARPSAHPWPRRCATASASATYAPVIAAVRVPPSACSTSQSSTMVFSPERLVVDDGAQRAADQPRDLVGAAADPALDRLAVGAGVGRARQHRVLRRHPAEAAVLAPARHAGRALAAQSTRVLPNSTSTEPAAWSSQLRVMVIGRSSSAARPSARVMPRPYLRPAEPNRPTNPCLRRAALGRATYLGRDVTPPGLRTIRRGVRLPRGRPGRVLVGPLADASQASTNEDMTPRALAAAVAAQLPDFDLVSAHQDRGGDADEEDALRVDLTFQASDGRRSSITVVATDDVGDFPGRRPCKAHSDILDGCVDTDRPDGTSSILLWQDRGPRRTRGSSTCSACAPRQTCGRSYDRTSRSRATPRPRPGPPRRGPARQPCRTRRSGSSPAPSSSRPATRSRSGRTDPAYDGQIARVTVIVELVQPDDRLWSAVLSAESTLSRQRIFTATHSRR